MRPIVIACDPGMRSGLALIDGGLFKASRSVKLKSATSPKERCNAITALLRAHASQGGDVHFVCERPYGFRASTGGNTVESLLKNVGAWESIAEAIGLRVVQSVYPSTWQATFNLAKGKRAQRMRGTLRIVRERWPLALDGNRKPEDEACAILLGMHYQWVRLDGPARTAEGLDWIGRLR